MRKVTALALCSSLLLPATAAVATPADAASRTNPVITNCSKTEHGVTVRIKARNEGRFVRVRVSHPDGQGNFKEPRVKSTRTDVTRESKAAPPSKDGGEIGTAIQLDRFRNDPSFRTSRWYRTTVDTTFKLTSGKRITLSCTVR